MDAGIAALPARKSPAVLDSTLKSSLIVIAALLPIWLPGIFGRVNWKPDEPREADIAWRMSLTGPVAVPELAGKPFVEKPPLSYWLSGTAIAHASGRPWLARLPNLLYAVVFATMLRALARTWASARGATIAALAGSTFLLVYQVAIWQATDALLIPCVAISLLGLRRGYLATTASDRLFGYSLMHLALAVGFLAKSAGAWLVPITTLLMLIVWDKRYRELLRWELYAGVIVQIVIVAPWLIAVGHLPDGSALLRNALWSNIAGRLTRVHEHASNLPQYADAHRNWFGKYFVEAPLYVFPWTFIVVAAARKCWIELREKSKRNPAWRFAVAATLPGLLLLSVATTARGIYAAPTLIGAALMLALWFDRAAAEPERFDLTMLKYTSRAVCVFALLSLLLLPAIEIFYLDTDSNTVCLILGAVLLIAAAVGAVRFAGFARQRHDVGQAMSILFVSYCVALTGFAAAYFPALNRMQDLTPVAIAVRGDLAGRALALLEPDETTEAVIDMARIHAPTLQWNSATKDHALSQPITDRQCVLAMTHSTRGPLSDFVRKRGFAIDAKQDRVDIAGFSSATGLRTEREYVVPDGRHYLLLCRAPVVSDPAG